MVPQQIAGGDIYPALENGTIDAAEWVGPYDDERLGFVKVAKYYYYPGWWEGCTQSGFFISLKQWEELPAGYRAAINAVGSEVDELVARASTMRATRGAAPAGSGRRELRPFPRDDDGRVLQGRASTYTASSRPRTPSSRRSTKPWKPFRDEQYLWFRVAENTFDNFVYAQQAAKKR